MSVERHLPPTDAAVIQVISFSSMRGDGSPENPERMANYYYSLDGRLLACYDPINGEPDAFLPLKPLVVAGAEG